MSITIDNLKRQVDVLKAYRQCQIATYYDDYKPVGMVDECCTLDRLKTISAVTGTPIKQGYKHAAGFADTLVCEWEGCRFWAPSGRCD